MILLIFLAFFSCIALSFFIERAKCTCRQEVKNKSISCGELTLSGARLSYTWLYKVSSDFQPIDEMIDFNRLGYTIITMSRAVCPDIECIDIVIQQTIIKK